ncbi:MAG TPA: SIS domain-containing protein [Jatrophihabitans sp.]|jgi:glucosamine--fructose-6-phosphate aminotransferase (isomerizing)
MTSEIAEQPQMLQRLLDDGAVEIGRISAELAARKPRFVLLAARGTSDHAALYAKYLIEVGLGLPAGLVSPSAMTVYGSRPDLSDVLFIAVSQSGGSPDLIDSLAAARACSAVTVAVTNNPGSALAEAAEFAVDVRAGVERAVAATKTYTAELLALYLLIDGMRSGVEAVDAAQPLAAAAEKTLAAEEVVQAAAGRYRFADRILTTARGYSYPTAREAALKLMETSYLGAQAFSGADLLHGPMAMVDADLPVIAVQTPGRGGAAMEPVIERLRQRHADLLLVGPQQAGSLPVNTEGIVEQLYPILEILPLQQLALQLALQRGGNPDAPRGLSKVTETW